MILEWEPYETKIVVINVDYLSQLSILLFKNYLNSMTNEYSSNIQKVHYYISENSNGKLTHLVNTITNDT